MYEELIKRLKGHANLVREYNESGKLFDDAADVIEELSKPKWIPVTERLPEKPGKYLVCGKWRGKPTEIWVCELIAFGKIKGWGNEARNPAVTHWMPLPEPPKK